MGFGVGGDAPGSVELPEACGHYGGRTQTSRYLLIKTTIS